ncbi:DUF3783 domain-containing protein [Clostridium sp. cel8]|uniref:DUF3783 domain-containing protein n=1 Tax=unclassified Clostridium TaxID=2614128 RepID=UPI00325FA9E3
MKKNVNKMILTYGLNENENKAIDNIKLGNTKLEHKIIEKSMVGNKLKDIVNGNISSNNSKNLPDEKVVLFNDVSEDELNKLIYNIKKSFDVKPIFAVITKTSCEWTFDYLLENLIDEREWFKKQQQNKK